MKYRVYAIGRPKLRFAAKGIDEYERRLTKRGDFRVEFLKGSKDESRQLFAASKGSYRFVLDERGKLLSTCELVAAVEALEMRGDIRAVSFLVGGADGHSTALRNSSDFVWAMSPLTLQHELALLLLLEQLYRVDTIKRGEPYHR